MDSTSTTLQNSQTNIKCCKSGWRMCKNGQWKFLISRGKRQRISEVDLTTGQRITSTRFIPPSAGPSCIWVTQEKLREYRNKRLRISNSEPAQLCDQCNAITFNSDVCPHCQTVLVNVMTNP